MDHDGAAVEEDAPGISEQVDFSVGEAAQSKIHAEPCIWDEDITRELQVEMALTLQRLMEQFAAACFSIQQTRSFDAVCVCVPGCICAIADSILRRRPTDYTSECVSHLMGQTRDGKQLGIPGFGLSVGTFAEQTETIEVHYPELNVARTAVIDYFQSPAQKRLAKIYTWENNFVLRPGRNLIQYLRNICRDIAASIPAPQQLLCDSSPEASLLLKNYPEMKAYRDLAFYWKYFLNPDVKVFPNYGSVSRKARMQGVLHFSWSGMEFSVQALGKALTCRPNPNQTDPVTEKPVPPEQLPKHRYPSTATPSFFVPPPKIVTEDDVIYRPNLPGFEDSREQGKVQSIAVENAHLLTCDLTRVFQGKFLVSATQNCSFHF